jgi:hypothetical protein
MSVGIYLLPIADGDAEIKRLADLIEGAAGELSPFDELHGFGIDEVDLEASALLQGRSDRLVKVQNANTAARLASRSSRAGALARKTSAWRSSAPSARKDRGSPLHPQLFRPWGRLARQR